MYHSGATATAGAIDKAVSDVFSSAHGGRIGVVKVSPLFMRLYTTGDGVATANVI